MTGLMTRATAAGEIKRALRAAPAWAVSPHVAARYVGIPWAAKGYDRAGCNCWGLVTLFYREVFGIELPRHEAAYDDTLLGAAAGLAELRRLARILRARIGPEWREIAWWEASAGDVLLLPIGDALCHVGIYAGDLHLLHVEEGSDSVLEDLRDGRLDARLGRAELYRYAGASGC